MKLYAAAEKTLQDAMATETVPQTLRSLSPAIRELPVALRNFREAQYQYTAARKASRMRLFNPSAWRARTVRNRYRVHLRTLLSQIIELPVSEGIRQYLRLRVRRF